MNKKISLPSVLEEILQKLKEIGVKPILVGGCVRDFILKIPCKDYDIELFNVKRIDDIQKILIHYGSVKLVGKSFGVLALKIGEFYVDFSLARVEKKISKGHTGFKIITDKKMKFKEASLRRDFTINSIGYDYFEEKILDPNHGLEDLNSGILRHINEKTFIEDPLRVYRAIQFCSRFNMKLHNKTFKLCENIVKKDELSTIPKERVFEEFKKLFLKSKKPSIGLTLLKDLKLLKYFEELNSLVSCLEDKISFFKGDLWEHTLFEMDKLSKILKKENIRDDYRRLYLFYAVLLHNLDKPYCIKKKNNKISFYEDKSLRVNLTKTFLLKITNEKKFIEKIISLVRNYLAPFQLSSTSFSIKIIKNLSLNVNIEDLCLICLSSCGSMDVEVKRYQKAILYLLHKSKELKLENKCLKPLILGRDLIKLGLKPSKKFKEILNYALQLQIETTFDKKELLDSIKKKFIKV